MMGLDTSHDAWRGPYSRFNAFRRRLAELAGFPPLDEMEGFKYNKDTYKPLPDALSWDGCPGDRRLVPLLNHSDCDGEIAPECCGPIADALEELAAKLPDDPNTEDGWQRRYMLRFAKGCRAAAAAGEPIDFH
jgi:hypothetical protein